MQGGVGGGYPLDLHDWKSSSKPIKRGDPRYFCQIFEDLYPTFDDFSPPKKSPWIHRVLARAGRFPGFPGSKFWQVLKRRVIWRWVVGWFDWRSFRFECRLFTPKSCFESFCLISSPEKKEWKHDVNVWKSFQHLPWKLTCPMKNSGWTTFDPLSRGHALVLRGWKRWRCAAHKMQRRPSTWAMQWHGCHRQQLPPWVTATGGRHVEVLKRRNKQLPQNLVDEQMRFSYHTTSKWAVGQWEKVNFLGPEVTESKSFYLFQMNGWCSLTNDFNPVVCFF